ncbi:alpha/beta fold hydrolase [Burkholderia ambifaria]|uniref:alpha/beta fold hydrolase n=1 Tax=Burkholderia ambifaria TaxID=152480 RepID=UPI001BA1BDA0|nr:alpha/beta hydrolase [Burkholderia ambifaria]MBR8257578.1 alpha/beta hydrolase [Burkholderia ambifaria]
MTAAQGSFDSQFVHRAAIADGVKIHYVTAGPHPGTAPAMLLIHGFPQNWWEWHHIMPDLARDYTLIVPDLRGVGLSDRPASGYTKRQLAADLHGVVEQLGCGPAHVVGHDIGGMVAYAYATQFPVRTLSILDVPVPGIGDWDRVVQDPRVWHFAFHQKRDLPEALICGGREHIYITTFINDRSHNVGAFSAADMAEYTAAYCHPGAFRAAMEMYRQFPQDAADNQAAGPLPADLKVLALGGDTRWGPVMLERIGSMAANVTGGSVANCGHFLAEEQPQQLIDALRKFCR